jgi:tetratricopeptide (TPR) repeat protein
MQGAGGTKRQKRSPAASLPRLCRQAMLLATLAFLGGLPVHSAGAGDTTDEARSLSWQAVKLLEAARYGEAEAVADKGLALCDSAVGFQAFCGGAFNEVLGDIAFRQSRYDAALDYYVESRRIRESGLGPNHPTMGRSEFRLGRTYAQLHRLEEALAALKHCVAIYETMNPPPREFTSALSRLAQVYSDLQRSDDAIAVSRTNVEVAKTLGPSGLKDLVTAKINLAVNLRLAGKNGEIADLIRDASRLAEGLEANDPTRGRAAREMAEVDVDEGKLPEAEHLAEQAVASEERQSPVDPALLATALYTQMRVFDEEHRYEEALVPARRAYRIALETGGPKSPHAAKALQQQGWLLIKEKHFPQAEAALAEALSILANTNSALLQGTRSALGELYLAQSRFGEAESILRPALLDTANPKPSPSWRARMLLVLGDVLASTGRRSEAIAAYRQAQDLDAASFGENSPVFFYAEDRLVRTEVRANQLTEARHHIDHEMTVVSRLGSQPVFVSTAKLSLGLVLAATKDAAGAEKAAKEAIALLDPAPPGSENTLKSSLNFLGTIYQEQRRFAEGEASERRALDLSRKIFGPGDPELPLILSNLGALYENWGRPADAIPYLTEVTALLEKRGQTDEVCAAAFRSLGGANLDLGHFPEARAAFQRSEEIAQRILPEDDPKLATAHNALGLLYLSVSDYKYAEIEYRAAALIEEKSPEPDIQARSETLEGLGLTDRETGRFAEGRALLAQAVKLEEGGGGARKIYLKRRLVNLSSILRREENFAEAAQVLSQALALSKPGDGDDFGRAEVLNGLGLVHSALQQYEKAEPLIGEALAIRKKILPENHPLVAESLGNLGSLYAGMARYSEAETLLRDALKRREAWEPPDSRDVVLATASLADLLVSNGRLGEAATLAQRALEIAARRFGPDSPLSTGIVRTFAAVDLAHGRYHEAEERYRRVLAIDEHSLGRDSPTVASDLLDLVPLIKRNGRREVAKADIERAFRIETNRFGEDSPICVRPLLASADVAFEYGHYAEARKLADHIRSIEERSGSASHPAMARLWMFLARIDLIEARWDDASAALDRASAIGFKVLPPGHPLLLDVLETRSRVAWAKGDLAERERYDREAVDASEKLFGLDNPTRQDAVDRLATSFSETGKFAEAEKLRRQILAMAETTLGAQAAQTAWAIRGLAAILGSSGRLDEAAGLLRRALAIDEAAYGAESAEAAVDHLLFGSILRVAGKYRESRTETLRALAISKSQPNELSELAPLRELASLAADQGRYSEGIPHLERSLGIAEKAYGADSPALAPTLALLGWFYALGGRQDEAGKMADRVQALLGKDLPEQSPWLQNVIQLQAALGTAQGDLPRAEASYRRLLALATKRFGPQGRAVAIYEFNLAGLHLRQGEFREAIAGFERALDTFKRLEGLHSPLVGETLFGAAKAYAGIGDKAKSSALLAAAKEILGEITADLRPEPKWL